GARPVLGASPFRHASGPARPFFGGHHGQEYCFDYRRRLAGDDDGAASAQTAQEHAAHHGQAATAASNPGMGAMMGGGVGRMMQMMGGGMMGGGTTMAPFSHIEGRIAFLKAELAVTDAQPPQWNAFAGAYPGNAKVMHHSMANPAQAVPPAN